jgi:hypothetical protein
MMEYSLSTIKKGERVRVIDKKKAKTRSFSVEAARETR